MAGAIVNPRVLNIAKPNARLRGRQRIIRARMGNITPPPIIARPAPAEIPASTSAPEPPEYEPEEEPTPEAPVDVAPSPNAEPQPEPNQEPAPGTRNPEPGTP